VAADGTAAPAAPRATTPPPRPASDEAIDLLGTAGAPVLKRAIPAVIGAVVVIGLIIWLVKK
jgi:hypothetical protein